MRRAAIRRASRRTSAAPARAWQTRAARVVASGSTLRRCSMGSTLASRSRSTSVLHRSPFRCAGAVKERASRKRALALGGGPRLARPAAAVHPGPKLRPVVEHPADHDEDHEVARADTSRGEVAELLPDLATDLQPGD